MPPKANAKEAAPKPRPTGILATEAIKEIKSFLDAYTKSSAAAGVEVLQNVTRRFREELRPLAELAEGATIPSLPKISLIIQNNISYETLQALLTALADSPLIDRLSFWSVLLGDDGAMLLSQFLSANKSLSILEATSCSIGPKGAWHLSRALATQPSLQALLLDHNPSLGDEGAIVLSDGIKWAAKLRTLSLCFCGIGDSGAAAIAACALRSAGAARVYLRGNSIGGVGLTAIAQSVAKSTAVETIDLSLNSFGADVPAGLALRDALDANGSLTSLDLQVNEIAPEIITALVGTVKERPNLTNVLIPERCPPAVFEQLLVALDANRKASKKKTSRPDSPKKA